MKYARIFACALALSVPMMAAPDAAIAKSAATAKSAGPAEGQSAQTPVAKDGYAYWLHLPPGYVSDKKARWPVMIFLHGSGERGSDLDKVKVHGPPKIAGRDPDFPFILISPQLPEEQDWDIAKLDAIVMKVSKAHRVDPKRLYLTGLSRGGHAAWRWAAAEPMRFAAVAPVAGTGDPKTACALKDTPLWAFHGDRDDVVKPAGSWNMAEAIRKCGGNPRLTIYPDLGHNAWDPAYDDPALYLWMLEKRLPDAKPNKAKAKGKTSSQ